MSTDKYAQFIAEQQRKLSVSGTNAVDLVEKKELSLKQKKIAAQAGDPEKIEGEDFAKLRAMKKEEVEQLDEVGDTPKGKAALKSYLTKAGKTTDKYHRNPGWYSDANVDRMTDKNRRKLNNRLSGEDSAHLRLTHRDWLYDPKRMKNKAKENAVRHERDKEHLKKEEVEQIDEISRKLAVKTLGMRMAQGREGVFGDDVAASKADATETRVKKKFGKRAVTSAEKIAHKELYGEATEWHTVDPDDIPVKTLNWHKKKVAYHYKKRDSYLRRGDDKNAFIHDTHAAAHETHVKDLEDAKNKSKSMKKEEVELISIEEQAYLEEMVGKGKLPDILAHHRENMLHHAKMCDHHNMMADKSEEVGDTVGFDHHFGMALGHEMDHQHHKVRYDHAAGLKARANAQREMKSASEAMAAASKKVADAKAWKREY